MDEEPTIVTPRRERESNWHWYVGMFAACLLAFGVIVLADVLLQRKGEVIAPQPTPSPVVIMVPAPTPSPSVKIVVVKEKPKPSPKPINDLFDDPYLAPLDSPRPTPKN